MNVPAAIDDNLVTLNVSGLPDGIYVLKIAAANITVAKKLAITR